MPKVQELKIALVHDWLLGVGGAEKTLKTLHEIFPRAPVYTLFYNKNFTEYLIPKAEIRTTFVQKIYQVLGSHKILTPLLPLAAESIELGGFDVVISSSVAFAKGLVLKPQTRHICYCYSPARQIWDWHAEYKHEGHWAPKPWVFLTQHFLRIWDRHASTRVDQFVAISENVRSRIKKYYNRDSIVIYPPVNLSPETNFETKKQKSEEDYFLIVSRLFKHKKIDVAVRAFNKLGWPLIIIGEGPELNRLKKIAEPNVRLLGYQTYTTVRQHYEGCLAFIMPQEEDFGMTPIEAMALGKPVLALKRGGALEYIQEGLNGEFFEDPTEEVLADGARRLKQNFSTYRPAEIKKTAERFSAEHFKNQIINLVENYID